MTTVNEVFLTAMSLMDELNDEGKAETEYTEEYGKRVPSIIGMLLAEKKIFSGDSGMILPVEDMEDMLIGVEDRYALSVMPYGLAANLLIDENPSAASFYQERYEELRDRFFKYMASDAGTVEDLYGGIEFGRFARW